MTEVASIESHSLDELVARRRASEEAYLEFLRRDALSAGVYELAAGATDPQGPHHEDEVYVVTAGSAKLRVGDEDVAVSAGTVVFVAAEVPHRFLDITEPLTVLVFFAPAESEG